jgi:hypothetical protein
VTEDNGLPLASLVTVANVSEVTVGLEVVDRAQPAWLLTKVTTALTSGGSFAGEGFSRLFHGGSGKTVAAGQAVLLRCIRPASVVGRWSGATGG